MMRYILPTLFLFLQSASICALSTYNFPAAFDLKQTFCSDSKYCMKMTEKGKKIGFLQLAEDRPNLFYFFDENNEKQLSIKVIHTKIHPKDCTVHYCPIFYDFDIYEKKNHLVAKLEFSYDVMQSSFNELKLYTKDRRYLLILGAHTDGRAGTETYLYDGISPEHKLALISRPLFTYSLDSQITILDRSRLFFILDPNVFSAALALYCNTSLFRANLNPAAEYLISAETLNNLRQKLQETAEAQGLLDNLHTHIDTHEIKAAGKDLNRRYQEEYGDFWDSDSLFNKEKKLQQLFEIGIDLLASHSQSAEEDQALLQFLISQLYINQPE
ncbi:MAG: hypothetical protein KBD30_03845 [Legionellaceae bacterium]|nr:hypothetical protein [Legionellaceae bacterium]